MKKKILSSILCAFMTISVLAGCGSADSAAGSGTSDESTDSAGADVNSEHAEVTMMLISPNSNESELNKIAKKASEITEAKFNTTLKLIAVTPADYTNKMNMALATGDTLDIFQGFELYGQYVAQEYMLDISE